MCRANLHVYGADKVYILLNLVRVSVVCCTVKRLLARRACSARAEASPGATHV
jgi:hypothetical protein